MSRRVREHLRSNIVGYVAIFMFAIGGTAYATHGEPNSISTIDIINGEVKTADIGTAEVTTADIANDTVATQDIADDAVTQNKIIAGGVRTSEIANGQVLSIDVGDNSLASGDILDETITDADVQNDPAFGGPFDGGLHGDAHIEDGTITGFDVAGGTLGGFHIGDNSLDGQDISDDFLTASSATDTSCNDDPSVGEVCATTTFNLGEAGRLLINATGEWRTFNIDADAPDTASMTCRIQVDGTTVGLPQSFGEATTGAANHPFPNNGTMALTGLSDPLTVGSHEVRIFCLEDDGDVDLIANQITAARVDE